MDRMQITTVPGAFGLAFPVTDPSKSPVAAETFDLNEAISKRFEDDRYLVSYVAEHRLKKSAAQELEVVCPYLILDIDYKGFELTQKWRDDLTKSFEDSVPDWCLHYHTPNGYRVVYHFDEPVTPEQHRSIVQYMMDSYGKLYNIEPDPACKDWTRLFRAPYSQYKDSGKSTWELCEPNVQLREDQRLTVTPNMLTRLGSTSTALAPTGEFSDRAIPEAAVIMESLSGGEKRAITTTLKKLSKIEELKDRSSQLAESLRKLQHQKPLVDNRNDSINQVVLYLCNHIRKESQYERIDPETVMEYLIRSVVAMDDDPTCDAPERGEKGETWYEHAWVVCCEQAAKVNAEELPEYTHFEREEPQEGFLELYNRKNEIKIEEEELQKYAIIRQGSKYHILQKDGTYTLQGYSIDAVRMEIGRKGNPLGIELRRIDHQKAKVVDVPKQQLIESHCTEIGTGRYYFEDSTERTLTLRRDEEGNLSTMTSSSCWNPQVVNRPRFDQEVHDWLFYLAGGNQMDWLSLQCWLAHFQDQNQFLPALMLAPESRSGKSLLIYALLDMYNTSSQGQDLLAALGYNKQRRNSAPVSRMAPLLFSEEGVVESSGITAFTKGKDDLLTAGQSMANRLKDLVTTNVHTQKVLYQQEDAEWFGTPRVVIASNSGKDFRVMSQASDDADGTASKKAYLNRILYLQNSPRAVVWCRENYNLMVEQGWARNGSPRCNDSEFWKREQSYTIARHIAYLHENRADGGYVEGGKRLSYDEVVTKGTDKLLTFRQNEFVKAELEAGSDRCGTFFDKVCDRVLATLEFSEKYEPTTDRGVAKRGNKGVYWYPKTRSFILTFKLAQSFLVDPGSDPEPKRTLGRLLDSWDVVPLKLEGTSQIRILWKDGQRGVLAGYCRTIPLARIVRAARSAQNQELLTELTNAGILDS